MIPVCVVIVIKVCREAPEWHAQAPAAIRVCVDMRKDVPPGFVDALAAAPQCVSDDDGYDAKACRAWVYRNACAAACSFVGHDFIHAYPLAETPVIDADGEITGEAVVIQRSPQTIPPYYGFALPGELPRSTLIGLACVPDKGRPVPVLVLARVAADGSIRTKVPISHLVVLGWRPLLCLSRLPAVLGE